MKRVGPGRKSRPRVKRVPRGFQVKGATLRMEDGSWVRVEPVTPRKGLPSPADYAAATREAISGLQAPMPVELPRFQDTGRNLGVLSLNDAHFGMLAWADQTGQGHYDLDIADRDYENTAHNLIAALKQRRDIGRVLYIAGSDMLHSDGPADNGAGGRTTRGTAVETVADHRIKVYQRALARIATTARRAMLALGVPIDICMVPGNHDRFLDQTMAVALDHVFLPDPILNLLPTFTRDRQYYTFHQVALMLTHGDLRSKRQESELHQTFADEYPGWSDAVTREVLMGHYHSASTELSETRGVRIRRLPALAQVDNYAAGEGYRHVRAGTALVYSPARFVASYEAGPKS